MKKLTMILAAAALVVGVIAPADAAKPTKLWEDAADDADLNQGLGASLPGGWDLAEATVVKKGANLEFTVTHHQMPPTGSAPEFTRFLWNFTVDGKPYRFTVKSVDIGKPDVAAGQTTERVGRVDVQGHFRLEGECKTVPGVGLSFVNCPPLEYLEGTWDPGAMSFTVILPLKAVKAKTGSVIGPGGVQICTICWVSHYAERSLDATIIDAATQSVTYKVPKK
ncbi:MAG: hypothetical protein ACRDI3_08405 [Actinomycetota bacterium]